MGRVSIGCGQCEKSIVCASPLLREQRAETLRNKLIESRVPYSMRFERRDDSMMMITATRPVEDCGSNKCPLSDEVFTNVLGLVLQSIKTIRGK